MSRYDTARAVLKNTVKRIINGDTPISFIALCDFGKDTLEKSIIRLPREDEHDLMRAIDYAHIKTMAAVERKKYLEDPYDEPRFEKSKNDLLAWQPLHHNLMLLFATGKATEMSSFEFAVAYNMAELKDEIDGLLAAVAAQPAA
jgi:hypothetical protein